MTSRRPPAGYTTPDGRPLRLGGLVEVAALLGMAKQSAARALKRPGAPLPVAELAMGPVYDLQAIEDWDATRKKTPGPAADGP